jgi:hypothetical protein
VGNVNVMGAEVRFGSGQSDLLVLGGLNFFFSNKIHSRRFMIFEDQLGMGYGLEITLRVFFFLVYMPTPRSQTPSINDRDMKTLAAGWIPCMHESNIRSTTLYLSL